MKTKSEVFGQRPIAVAIATLTFLFVAPSWADPLVLTARSHAEDYGCRVIEWSYTPTITEESGELVVNFVKGGATVTHSRSFCGVAGEIGLSNPGGVHRVVKLVFQDGSTATGARASGHSLSDVSKLTMDFVFEGREWSLKWDVAAMLKAKEDGKCARPVARISLAHFELDPAEGGDDPGGEMSDIFTPDLTTAMINVTLTYAPDGEIVVEDSTTTAPEEAGFFQELRGTLQGAPGVMSATLEFDVCYEKSDDFVRGWKFFFSPIPGKPDVVVGGDGSAAAKADLKTRAAQQRDALVTELANPAILSHAEWRELNIIGSDAPVRLRVTKALLFFNDRVEFTFNMRPRSGG